MSKILQNKFLYLNHRELWPISFDCKSVMIRLMDMNPNKRYSLEDVMTSNWLETTIIDFLKIKIDKFTIRTQLQNWQKLGSLDAIEKGIRRAISKSVDIINKK